MKIRTRLIIIILTTVSLILAMQLFFYYNIMSWGRKTADSMFNTVVEQNTSQIEKLCRNVQNITFRLSTDASVQNGVFHYSPVEIIRRQKEIERNMGALIFGEQSLHYVAVINNGSIMFTAEQNMGNDMPDVITPGTFALELLEKTNLSSDGTQFVVETEKGTDNYFAYVSKMYPTDITITDTDGKFIVSLFKMNLSNDKTGSLAADRDFFIRMVNENDIIIYSNHNDEIGLNITEVKSDTDNFLKKENKVDYVEGQNWRIICSMPSESVLNLRPATNFLFIAAIIVNILIVAVMSTMFFKMISVSIDKIKKGIHTICEGNWEYRLDVEENNEIGNIASNINYMLERIEKLTEEREMTLEKLHQTELLQKQTMIDYLQNQISPHFLYNSMEHIKGIALEHQIPEISNMTALLSKVFWYAQNKTEFANVGEDLDAAFDYFSVVNMRRKDPVLVKYNISTEIMSIPIIRMVFQPIFENAMKHGLKYRENGVLEVTAEEKGDFVSIIARDNGNGMEKEALAQLQNDLENQNIFISTNGGHIGLMNVNRRLKLYYGDDCGVSVYAPPDGGFCTVVTIKRTNKILPSKEDEI